MASYRGGTGGTRGASDKKVGRGPRPSRGGGFYQPTTRPRPVGPQPLRLPGMQTAQKLPSYTGRPGAATSGQRAPSTPSEDQYKPSHRSYAYGEFPELAALAADWPELPSAYLEEYDYWLRSGGPEMGGVPFGRMATNPDTGSLFWNPLAEGAHPGNLYFSDYQFAGPRPELNWGGPEDLRPPPEQAGESPYLTRDDIGGLMEEFAATNQALLSEMANMQMVNQEREDRLAEMELLSALLAGQGGGQNYGNPYMMGPYYPGGMF